MNISEKRVLFKEHTKYKYPIASNVQTANQTYKQAVHLMLFFVVQGKGSAILRMQGIELLEIKSVSCNTSTLP